MAGSTAPGSDAPKTTPAAQSRMRLDRLARLQQSLRVVGCAGAVLSDPINIRYACDARNMQVWTMHVPSRYLFVPPTGRATLFDYRGAEHLAAGLETLSEIRPAVAVNHYSAGAQVGEEARKWAGELAELVRDAGPGPLAIDRTSVAELDALTNVGIDVAYAQDIVEQARMLKSADEVQAMQASIRVAEQALAEIEQAAEPGVSENHLWAILNRVNAERDGEWIETRLLNSGPRTRPWYQEASPRVIQDGDLVCLDTDMIGPFGYNADISRTFLAGDQRRSGDQRTLYALAIEQLDHNAALLRDGVTFAEFHEQAFQPPTGYRQHSFGFVHGVGLSVEYPRVPPSYESLTLPYDGVFRADMIVCAESYIAADHGSQGVKLENPYLIHDRGSELLTAYPFSDALAT